MGRPAIVGGPFHKKQNQPMPMKNMKKHLTFLTCLLGLSAAPCTTPAQERLASAENDHPQVAGLREFTLGGSGSSNKTMDNSFGTLDFSFGSFTSPRSEWVLRQSASYSNPDNGDNGWIGSTRLAYDWHFNSDAPVRPLLGVNAGRIYGNNVTDTWTAGLEGGAKIFMKAQTFVYVLGSYDWLFDRGSQIDDRFSDGRFGWSVGVGYQF